MPRKPSDFQFRYLISNPLLQPDGNFPRSYTRPTIVRIGEPHIPRPPSFFEEEEWPFSWPIISFSVRQGTRSKTITLIHTANKYDQSWSSTGIVNFWTSGMVGGLSLATRRLSSQDRNAVKALLDGLTGKDVPRLTAEYVPEYGTPPAKKKQELIDAVRETYNQLRSRRISEIGMAVEMGTFCQLNPNHPIGRSNLIRYVQGIATRRIER